jgi:hypothetical protein
MKKIKRKRKGGKRKIAWTQMTTVVHSKPDIALQREKRKKKENGPYCGEPCVTPRP